MMSKKLLLFKIIVIIGSNNLKSVLSVLYSCMDMGYGIVRYAINFFFLNKIFLKLPLVFNFHYDSFKIRTANLPMLPP